MRTRSRCTSLLLAAFLASSGFVLAGCTGFFDSYPNADEPADLVGTWTHAAGRITLNEDGSFEMTDMPKWVALGDSSGSGSSETVSCTGTWTLSVEIQNFWLSSEAADCGGGGFATGRQGEMTIAFGIDSGSGDPRCYELVREDSNLTPRGYEDCLQYN